MHNKSLYNLKTKKGGKFMLYTSKPEQDTGEDIFRIGTSKTSLEDKPKVKSKVSFEGLVGKLSSSYKPTSSMLIYKFSLTFQNGNVIQSPSEPVVVPTVHFNY
jgi:hypothetical protein